MEEEEGEHGVGDEVEGDGPVVGLIFRPGPVGHLVAVSGVDPLGEIAVMGGPETQGGEVFQHLPVPGDVARGQYHGLFPHVAAVNSVVVPGDEGDHPARLVLLQVQGPGIPVQPLVCVQDHLFHDLAHEEGGLAVLVHVVARLLHDVMGAGVLRKVRPLVVAAEEVALDGLTPGLQQPFEGLLALVHIEPEQVLVHPAAADAHPVPGELLFVDEHPVLPLDMAADGGDMGPVGHQALVLVDEGDRLPQLDAPGSGGQTRDAAADDGHVRRDGLLNETLVDLRGRRAPGIPGCPHLGIGIVFPFDEMHVVTSRSVFVL